MKRIVPPILFVISVVVMVGLWLAIPSARIFTFPITLVGVLPLLFGLAIGSRAQGMFNKARTNIRTFKDPDVLVTDGPFQISRNPMYLGFAMILFGISILLGSLAAVGVAVTFLVITDRWYVEFEEAAMEKRFGDQYTEYKGTTRRWL